MRLFDTHAHLLDTQFDEDRDELIAGLPARGVVGFVECCCREEDFDRCLALMRRYPWIRGAAGIHPEHADAYGPDTPARLREVLADPGMIAVGEIGLDYHWDDAPERDVQRRAFSEQTELAVHLGLPVIVHDRDAHGDTAEILRAHRQGLSGILHCFSGSWEMARECMDYGMYIAFGGAVTFKNAHRQREIAAKIPEDRLLIETDSPYMAPEPFRGKRNDPGRIENTVKVLAEVRGADAETLAERLYRNACTLFRIPYGDPGKDRRDA